MSLPVYFVQPPGLPTPPGKSALCSWHLQPDGHLTGPAEPEPCDALVFDDRKSLPNQFDSLMEELLSVKEEVNAAIIVLDFERSPSPASLSFVKSLSDRCQTAAPQPYCPGTKAEPIFCYCPRQETFEDFARRIRVPNAWLELRPIDEAVFYPLSGVEPHEPSPEFFSEILQCCYRAESTSDGLCLHLYDTPETLLHRLAALSPHLQTAIGLRSELEELAMIDFIFSP